MRSALQFAFVFAPVAALVNFAFAFSATQLPSEVIHDPAYAAFVAEVQFGFQIWGILGSLVIAVAVFVSALTVGALVQQFGARGMREH